MTPQCTVESFLDSTLHVWWLGFACCAPWWKIEISNIGGSLVISEPCKPGALNGAARFSI